MFRYHHAFRLVADLARSGTLGPVFAIRAHMSTRLTYDQRKKIAVHQGGILYDLSAHMLDQIVWTLGRPQRITSFLRNDATPELPTFADNTLAVLEYDNALATVDIAAMEARPMARRYELYGTNGSAIITEPFEPAKQIRLTLESDAGEYKAGQHIIDVPGQSRQDLYDRELEAFLSVVQRGKEPDRTLAHESLVQETLLRTVRILT
jgi:predicted dehydrogenase